MIHLGIRERLCFEISRRLIKPPSAHTTDYDAYSKWRADELAGQWRFFSETDIRGKEVCDFGCGLGNLSIYLARFEPKRIVGVELEATHVAKCVEIWRSSTGPNLDRVSFIQGSTERLPFDDGSFDTLLAFDCVEHIMEPEGIMRDWHRVLRPGGKVLIWWSPYRSPYGPHMEAVVPIPWAHVIFGERAVMQTAARIYDLEEFVPRPWHFNEDGTRKPNVWKQWHSFKEQGYINELTMHEFFEIAKKVGLEVSRFDAHSFSSTPVRKLIGSALARLPVIGEYMTSFYIAECTKIA